MKNTTILLLAGILMLTISCTSNELSQLKHENEKLKLQLAEAFLEIQSDTISIAKAGAWAQNFRDRTDSLEVPLSWRFEARDLVALASKNNTYIRFYSVVEPNSNKLKIVAVGVDTNNNDVLTINIGGQMVSNIYNFAETCPGEIGCSISPSVLFNQSFKQNHAFVRYKKK